MAARRKWLETQMYLVSVCVLNRNVSLPVAYSTTDNYAGVPSVAGPRTQNSLVAGSRTRKHGGKWLPCVNYRGGGFPSEQYRAVVALFAASKCPKPKHRRALGQQIGQVYYLQDKH